MSDSAFEKSVLNWLSEATSILASLLERGGMSGSKILADACERCWAGFPAASGGPDTASEAEIDALEFVVEEGRIGCGEDYGILRQWLIRLRKEWEFRDSPEPIEGAVSDRPKPIGSPAKTNTSGPRNGAVGGPDPVSRKWNTPGRTPAKQTTPGECSKPPEGTSEPVAWAVVSDSTEEIDCEFIYPDRATAGDVALDSNGGVVPLYRRPQPMLTDAEREALHHVVGDVADITGPVEDTIRGLLERMAQNKTGGYVSRNAKVPVAYAVVDRDDDTVYAISLTEGTRNWPNSKCVPLYRN